jgi:hypothetical protein
MVHGQAPSVPEIPHRSPHGTSIRSGTRTHCVSLARACTHPQPLRILSSRMMHPLGKECPVPEISRFLGIVIPMYFDEHNPPHFH